MKICDMDCFNCKFEDCINDELEYEDYVRADKLSEEIKKERLIGEARDRIQAYCKTYQEVVRGKKRAYGKMYQEVNWDRIRIYKKKHYKENRDKLRAYARGMRAYIKTYGKQEKTGKRK